MCMTGYQDVTGQAEQRERRGWEWTEGISKRREDDLGYRSNMAIYIRFGPLRLSAGEGPRWRPQALPCRERQIRGSFTGDVESGVQVKR